MRSMFWGVLLHYLERTVHISGVNVSAIGGRNLFKAPSRAVEAAEASAAPNWDPWGLRALKTAYSGAPSQPMCFYSPSKAPLGAIPRDSGGELASCSYERQPETATIQTVEGESCQSERGKMLERDAAETRRVY